MSGVKRGITVTTVRPCSHCAKFCLVCRKSVNAKPFLVGTIFCTHQNFARATKLQRFRRLALEAVKILSREKILCFLPSIRHWVIKWSNVATLSCHFNWARWIRTEASVNREWFSYHSHISTEHGLRKMALVEMDFEPRFCRARKSPVRVKTTALAAYSQLN